MDITETLAPKSDQLDAVDLAGGSRIFTVESVSKGNPDQPVNVHLREFPRVWRPGKSMRRVLAAAWTADASTWAGKRVELYCDPTVEFGGAAVGGTRIRAMSGLDKPLKVPLLVKRGKSAVITVQPLPDAPAPDPLQAAKSALWAAWTEGHDADPAALAEAFQAATSKALGDANADDLAAFTETLRSDA